MAETKDMEACSLDADVSGTVVLTSADEKSFTIERKHALMSKLIFNALENGLHLFLRCLQNYVCVDAEAKQVPLPGVKSEVLQLVLNYLNHHQGVEPAIIEKPLRSKNMKDVCKDKFDAEFIDAIGDNRQQLYDLILASNFLDIKSLLCLVRLGFFCLKTSCYFSLD